MVPNCELNAITKSVCGLQGSMCACLLRARVPTICIPVGTPAPPLKKFWGLNFFDIVIVKHSAGLCGPLYTADRGLQIPIHWMISTSGLGVSPKIEIF